METLTVISSNILALHYDAKEKYLEVDFTSGSSYIYREVPLHIWQEFQRRTKAHESIGQYFSAHVRNNYKYQKIS